ncbi:unnamed protein product [Psylliodes chrysocephalus]|uniref:Uncharacterized protein n=1 Tax=Psylliodes chrysocephalus TaxID=3402493 RepID=A0A9P0GK00_9CUCU|nr:unnamed protein product [Psylliodes chrysocephala]
MSYFKNMREVTFLICLVYLLEIGTGVPQESCEVSCDEDKLIAFLASMEVLSPESIFNLAINELESICSQLTDNLKVIEKSFNDCKTKDARGLYISLIRGVQAFNNRICCADNNPYIKKFYVVHPCLFELRQDFESCNGPADWNEEPDDRKVCKTYKTILDCYYIKSAKVCGQQAAMAMSLLIEDVVENVLGHSCKGINSFPLVKDMMPDKYIERTSSAKGITSSTILVLKIGLLGNIIMLILFP